MAHRRKEIRLATRASALALAQARIVSERIRAAFPEFETKLIHVQTPADRDPQKPLRSFGDKGVFVREVERAVLAGDADAAVHSLKDVPGHLPPNLALVAMPVREDPCDVLVSREGYSLASLPSGARVATSSLRRRGQILSIRPDVKVVEIRGNVDTRLRKLVAGEVDALILAHAGLVRLGTPLPSVKMVPCDGVIPAPGQGALAVEATLSSDLQEVWEALDDPRVRLECETERNFVRAIGADCHTPVGCLCRVVGSELTFRAVVCSPDGARTLRWDRTNVPLAEAQSVAEKAASDLLAAGAGEIMEFCRSRDTTQS